MMGAASAPTKEQTVITFEQWQRISAYDQVGILRMTGVRKQDGSVYVDLAQLTMNELYRLADIVNRLEAMEDISGEK